MKSILDNVERLNQSEETEPDTRPPGVLLVITYKGDEQELFYMTKEAAIKAVNRIWSRIGDEIPFDDEIPFCIALSNDEEMGIEERGCVGEQVEDFRGIVMIGEDVRAVRIVNPEELSKD